MPFVLMLGSSISRRRRDSIHDYEGFVGLDSACRPHLLGGVPRVLLQLLHIDDLLDLIDYKQRRHALYTLRPRLPSNVSRR